MKRPLLFVALLVLVLLAGAAYYERGALSVVVMRRVANQLVGANIVDTLPDGLHAGFCGTGSPLPDPKRSGPCTAIIAGRHLFVVDAGRGASGILTRMALPPARVEAVLLTHFHSDHIDGLGELALQHWAGGAATTPLPVIAPEGVERVIKGFNEAYALDGGYRTAHHGPSVAPPSGFGLIARPFAPPAVNGSVVIYDREGLRITAFAVDHGPVHPAVGYRFDYRGRSIVVSGDTAPTPNLVAAATGADLLIHEALSPALVGVMEQAARAKGQMGIAHIMHDILSYHTAPGDAAAEARAAGVKALAFTHIIPPLPLATLDVVFLGDAAKRFAGTIFLCNDGDLISLPAAGGMKRRHVLR
jgi:ribonuclease Z